MYTTASVLFKTLADAGVTHAFVNWGNDHPAFLEELQRERLEGGGKTLVEIITCPHEMVALSAAQGYAQVTGKPAAVIVHVDVGTQGLAGAVHNVDRGQTPVLIFAGAAPQSSDARLKGTKNEWPMWLQDVPDQPAIVRQYMRYTVQLQSGKNTRQIVMRALQIAKSQPKGPVYLWARRETTEEEVDASFFDEKLDVAKWPPVQPGGLEPSAVTQIVDALLTAKFPLIITANSGRNPRTVPLLSALSTALGVGVFMSCPSAVCIPFGHPNYFGVSFGGKNTLLEDADVLLLIDVDIPWIDSKGNRIRDGARVFVIDSDPLKTTFAWSHVDAERLCRADTEVALQQLLGATDVAAASAAAEARQPRLESLRSAWLHAIEEAEQPSASPGETVSTVPLLLASLREAVRKGTPSGGEKVLWLNESISSFPLAWTHLKPEQPGSVIASGGSSLGYALGAAVGAHMGNAVAGTGHDLIVAVVGDGGFLFGVPASAYWLAKRYNTPFLTIVLNNGGWFSPKSSMMNVYPEGHGSRASGQELTVGFGPDMPDYAGVAAAAGGAWGRRVEKAAELNAVFEQAVRVVLGEKRSAVVDCIIQSI